jgi:hypothetical protein
LKTVISFGQEIVKVVNAAYEYSKSNYESAKSTGVAYDALEGQKYLAKVSTCRSFMNLANMIESLFTPNPETGKFIELDPATFFSIKNLDLDAQAKAALSKKIWARLCTSLSPVFARIQQLFRNNGRCVDLPYGSDYKSTQKLVSIAKTSKSENTRGTVECADDRDIMDIKLIEYKDIQRTY